MGVFSSLSVAVETLKRNPVLLVAGLVVALVNGVVAGGQMLSSGANALLWSLGSFAVQFASLFFVAGAYGMVAEALDGTTRLNTLVSEGKQNFADALAATILLVVAMVAAFVFVGFVAFLVAIGAITTDVGTGLSPVLLVGGMALVYLVALLPVFFLQFYLPAVVISDRSPAESLKQSYRLVRRNLLSTLGFDAVVTAVFLVGSLPTVWLYVQWADVMMTTPADQMTYPFANLPPTAVGTYVAATVVLGTLIGTFFYVYQVAFYKENLLGGADAEVESGVADEAA
jgi:hypothetical protein